MQLCENVYYPIGISQRVLEKHLIGVNEGGFVNTTTLELAVYQ